MSYQPGATAGASDLNRSLLDSLYDQRFPKIVSTFDLSECNHAATQSGANGAIGVRVSLPETGTITAMMVFIDVSSGNLDLGIYDTAATTRNRLRATGSTVAGSAGSWQSINLSSSLTVAAHDQVDFVWAASSATATVVAANRWSSSMSQLAAGWMPVAGGGAPWTNWSAATVFPLPATIAESGFSGTFQVPLILAKYA